MSVLLVLRRTLVVLTIDICIKSVGSVATVSTDLSFLS